MFFLLRNSSLFSKGSTFCCGLLLKGSKAWLVEKSEFYPITSYFVSKKPENLYLIVSPTWTIL
jgi:hypothetical protein